MAFVYINKKSDIGIKAIDNRAYIIYSVAINHLKSVLYLLRIATEKRHI